MDFRKIIFNEMVKEYNKKYKECTSLKEYLNKNYTKDELLSLVIMSALLDKEEKLHEILSLKGKGKDKLIDFVVDDLPSIIKNNLLLTEEYDVEFLNNILKEGSPVVINAEELPLTFINNLGHHKLVHFCYDEKAGLININIQKDIADEIKKILNNKSFTKEHKKIINFEDNIEMLLEIYGIIDNNRLYKMYNETFEKMDYKLFDDLLTYVVMKDNSISYKKINNTEYTISIDLEDEKLDKLLDYINNNEGDYKTYPKEFYISVMNREYLKSLKSYQLLYDYFLRDYDLDLDKDTDVFELVVVDYIYQMQISREQAKENILKNLDHFFDINSKEKNIIISYLNKIYYEYPKWCKKGNI